MKIINLEDGIVFHIESVSDITKMRFIAELNRYKRKISTDFIFTSKCKSQESPEVETYVYNRYTANRLEMPGMMYIPSKYIIHSSDIETMYAFSVTNCLNNLIEFISVDKLLVGTLNRKIDYVVKVEPAYNRTLMIIVTSTPHLLDNCLTSLLYTSTNLLDVDVVVVYHDKSPKVLQNRLINFEDEDFEYFTVNGCRLAKYEMMNIKFVKTAIDKFNYSKIHNMVFTSPSVRKIGYKYFLLCNDDIVFSANTDPIGKMMSCAKNESAGIVGAALYYDASHKLYQHGGIKWDLNFDRINNISGMYKNRFSTRRTSAVTFAFVLIDAKVVETLGGLNEKYYGDCSDISFCVDALKIGCRIWYCAEAELIHLESVSRKKDTSKDCGVREFFNEYKKDIISEVIF